MAEERVLTTAQAATFLGFSPATLAAWRTEAKGPQYFTLGQRIRYRMSDLEQWAFGGAATQWEIAQTADCHRERRSTVKRARGRAGAEQRKRRLAAEPLCRDCSEHGVKRLAEEVDHIVPLSQGGSDTEDNVRCLCRNCHAARTREQRLGGRTIIPVPELERR
jgi:5-methylcytosine-specific restriction protein A